MNERSLESIMKWLTDTVRSKKPISPFQFVEACEYMIILIGDEHTKLYDLQQKVAIMKRDLLEKEEKVNKVTIIVQASDLYKEMKIQESFIKQIEESARIGKIMARLKDNEMRLN